MQNEIPAPAEEIQQEISLSQIFASIASHRVAIFIASIVLAALLAGVSAVIIAFQPTFTQASVVTRLNFTGADKGLYPNGTAFAPSDLLDTSVVQAVFERNNLDKAMKFSDFKQALSITAQNPEIERLQREYTARLSERTLSSTDRSKLEQEFESKLQGMQNAEFTLSLSSNETLFARSDIITGKLFEEILTEWASRADAKGIFNYNIELFTPNMLATIQRPNGDYIIVYDQIRTVIEQLTLNLEKIQKLQHANLVRAGTGNLTIADLRLQLQEILHFRLSEILGLIRSAGLSRDTERSVIYINEQIVYIDREIAALTKKREIASSGLQSYMDNRTTNRSTTATQGDYASKAQSPGNPIFGGNSIPQFGESFLDRIIDITSKSSDTKFRQDLAREEMKIANELVTAEREKEVYVAMLKALTQSSVTDLARREEMKKWVETSIKEITAQLQESIVLIQEFYNKVSAQDLKPTRAYDIITPLRVSKNGIISAPKKLALGAFGVWVVGFLGFCALAALFPKKPTQVTV